eukprot:Plantae.Rhodophyta-Rhodochaete_pulchella.ctg43143.p1 GENE.Plantae.Rhodophyta-Rhodochaete_pulchella.ctg43143~~Plantae.Rhodophyta-Rhodochaete_pulchella.ctg43143.p1  ORF type:complete len:280 (+),score=37.17 Plantae.Rhodophyta-Rhodochaete_pulchella.ctg43143:107-841(+)
MLLRVPIVSVADKLPQKLIAFADKVEMPSVKRSVCCRLGAQANDRDSFAESVYWYTLAGERQRAAKIAERALTRAELCGPYAEEAEDLARVVEAVWATGDSDVQEQLQYARYYAQFQACVRDGIASNETVREAVSLAVLLVTRTGGLPRRHWLTLLYDTIEYLRKAELDNEEGVPIQGTDALYTLMGALQSISSSALNSDFAKPLQERLDARAMDDQETEPTVCVKEMRQFLLQRLTYAIAMRV